MANITIKRFNGSNWNTELYPKTTIDQVYSGGNSVVNNGKLRLDLLPDVVFGGLRFIKVWDGGYTEDAVTGELTYNAANARASLVSDILSGMSESNLTTVEDYLKSCLGRYVIVGEDISNISGVVANLWDVSEYETGQEELAGHYDQNSFSYYNTIYFGIEFSNRKDTMDGDDQVTETTNTGDYPSLQTGDWLVFESFKEADFTDGYVLTFGIVNNTYGYATASAAGIIKIANYNNNNHLITGSDIAVPTSNQLIDYVQHNSIQAIAAADNGGITVSNTDNVVNGKTISLHSHYKNMIDALYTTSGSTAPTVTDNDAGALWFAPTA